MWCFAQYMPEKKKRKPMSLPSTYWCIVVNLVINLSDFVVVSSSLITCAMLFIPFIWLLIFFPCLCFSWKPFRVSLILSVSITCFMAEDGVYRQGFTGFTPVVDLVVPLSLSLSLMRPARFPLASFRKKQIKQAWHVIFLNKFTFFCSLVIQLVLPLIQEFFS